MLKGTLSERSYSLGWGKRIALGDFRSLCIGVRSDPLRIFPYPEEVPTCIERFFKWRDSAVLSAKTDSVEQFVDALEHLPHAITQAAADITENNISVEG